VITTFGLVSALCVFIALRPLRRFTPAMIPFLYALMVPLEAAISGTSTNPARSLGPASSRTMDRLVDLLGGADPGLTGVHYSLQLPGMKVEEAKLYHFESEQRKVFGR